MTAWRYVDRRRDQTCDPIFLTRTTMSWTLLSIPPEIRDVIIETTLLSSRPVPPDITTASITPRSAVGSLNLSPPFLSWSYGLRNVKFEENPTDSNASSLLLTNRQLNVETRSVIGRLDERVRSYELDVMVVNEREFWPTWIFVPVLTRCVERIDVTFRIYGRSRDVCSALAPDGYPPRILWCFYFLLEHFLKRGTGSAEEKDKEVYVKVMNVDFVAGKGQEMLGEEERTLWLFQRGVDRPIEDTRIMRPAWLAGVFLSRLVLLLCMNYHTAEYGALLHERVGIIRVLIDGRLSNELDVGRALGKLAFSDIRDTFGHIRRQDRLSSFWKWKKDAVKLRYERGLPIAENIVFEE